MRAFDYESLILEEILTELQKTKQELIDMYYRLQAIIKQSEHEGEKDNARSLLNKVIRQLENEYNWQRPKEPGSAEYKKASKAYQRAADDAFKIVFFGRYKNPLAGQRGSDKVWGWGVKGDHIYHFWGPTGKTPQVKRMKKNAFNLDASNRKAQDKARKGYKKMSAETSAEWIRQVLKRNPKFSEGLEEAYREGIINSWPKSTVEVFELAYSGGHYEVQDGNLNPVDAMDKFLKHIPFEDVVKQLGDEAILMHPNYDFRIKVRASIHGDLSKFDLEVIQ